MKPATAPTLLTGFLLFISAAAAASAPGFRETDLASDLAGRAAHQDARIVNPWGIIPGPDHTFWVAANGSGNGLLLHDDGVTRSAGISIPGEGNPTGVVSEGAEAFTVRDGDHRGRARLIFAGEDGSISAWSPALDRDHAIQVATTEGAVYKGLAIAHGRHGSRLLVTNFHTGTIDVFDDHFSPVTSGGFKDADIPEGYAPFNIVNFHDRIYVTFAKQDEDAHDDVAGSGFGFVDVFEPDGRLVRRLISNGVLNAPWGLAFTRGRFGPFHHALLVGNFGDGRINAFDPETGASLGTLEGADGEPISISGLWGLTFGGEGDGEGDREGDDEHEALYFTAGINKEDDGLFGKLEPLGKRQDESERPVALGRNAPAPALASAPSEAPLQLALVGPNPARASNATGIRFRVSGGGGALARVGIYDLAGRLVAEPLRDAPIVGIIEARWDGRMLRGGRAGAGAYFIRVEAGGQVARERVVLIP